MCIIQGVVYLGHRYYQRPPSENACSQSNPYEGNPVQWSGLHGSNCIGYFFNKSNKLLIEKYDKEEIYIYESLNLGTVGSSGVFSPFPSNIKERIGEEISMIQLNSKHKLVFVEWNCRWVDAVILISQKGDIV